MQFRNTAINAQARQWFIAAIEKDELLGDIGNPLTDGGHLLRAGRISEALRLFKQADESGEVLASMPLVRDPSGELRVGSVTVTEGLDEAAQAREAIGEAFEDAGKYSVAAS